MSCFKHIVGNIKAAKTIPSLGARIGELWSIQAAKTEVLFEVAMNKLSEHNPAAASYLLDIPRETWTLHKQIEKDIPVFGKRTSNTIESENARYMEVRRAEPLFFLHKLCRQQLELNNESRENVKKWKAKNMLLTKAIHDMNEKNEKMSNSYVVFKIDDTEALVSHGDSERTVKFGDSAGTCSCFEWQQFGYPCRHAIIANKKLGYKTDIKQWYEYAFLPIYHLSNYEKAYSNPNIRPPSLNDLVPEVSIDDDENGVVRLPPSRYKTVGRPTKKRKRKRTETADGQPAREYKCSNCGSSEHNRLRCPNTFIETTI
jgi:hypothetical protein